MEINDLTKYFFKVITNCVFLLRLNIDNKCRVDKYDSNTRIRTDDVFKTFEFAEHMVTNAIRRYECFRTIKCMLLMENNHLLISYDGKKAADLDHYIVYLSDDKNNRKIRGHLIDVKKYISTELIKFKSKRKTSKKTKKEIKLALEKLFLDILDLEIEPLVYELGKELCSGKNVESTFIAKNKKTKVNHIFNYYKISLHFILEILKSCIIHDLQIDGTDL
jgi:hypothetical protein